MKVGIPAFEFVTTHIQEKSMHVNSCVVFNFQMGLNHDMLLNGGHEYHYKYLHFICVPINRFENAYVNCLN